MLRVLLALALLAGLWMPSAFAAGNPNGGRALPATLFIPWPPYPGLEPSIPGQPYPVVGCGYIVGRDIIIKDTVRLEENPAWGGLVIPPGVPGHPELIGVTKTWTFNIGPPKANGCLNDSYWEDSYCYCVAWGIGSHLFQAYQIVNGAKPKQVAEWRWDTYLHHQYMADDERDWCYFYHTPDEC